jgi:hypothetical protein
MNEFSAVCRVLGCPNFGVLKFLAVEPVNVVCGACQTQITDIIDLGVVSDDSSI